MCSSDLNTLEGRNKCLKDHGYIPPESDVLHLLPGVSPGRQTPCVDEFLKDKKSVSKFLIGDTLSNDRTMTEKITELKKDHIVIVKVVSFYSKLFTESQIRKYSSMEKEFLSLMLCLLNFREYFENCPVGYLLTDSQPEIGRAHV